MSLPLLRRELRANYKMILLFLAVITLYSTVIIAMYDPKLGASLDLMAESMPELFAAFGMTNAGATMLDFIANYLYGFILIAIPMLCLVRSQFGWLRAMLIKVQWPICWQRPILAA